MSVRLPIVPAYFFERTGRAQRLFLWLPPGHMRTLVKRGEASREILRDFPHGLDVKVSTHGFADLEREYGLRLEADPESVRWAFLTLMDRDQGEPLRSGFLERDFLDNLARTVKRRLQSEEVGPEPDRPESLPIGKRRRAFKRHRSREKAIRKALKAMPVRSFRKGKPIPEQSFARVEMGRGKEPGKVFEAVQRLGRRN